MNEVLHAKNEIRYQYFSSWYLDLPKWEDIINCIDYTIQNQKNIDLLTNGGLLLHNADIIDQAKKIKEEYSKLDSSLPCTAHTYISFSKVSSSLGYHCDTADVLYWQVIGNTRWNVSNVVEYDLSPGDAIYIPKGIYHQVFPQCPRVGISFGLDY